MSALPPAESGNESGARCVLWHAPGKSPPGTLLRALGGRGFRVRAVQSPYAAMAELCLLERRPAAAEGSRHFVLLLAEPESLSDRDAVLAAMRRYASRAVAWVYEPGANTPLRALVQEVAPRAPTAPRAAGRPELRLTGEGPRSPVLDPEEEQADIGHTGNGLGHLLSDEELAMLLDETGPRAGGSADVD